MAAELSITYAVPNGSRTPEWQLSEGEIQVVEYMDGVIEVHDPIFDMPYRFGDGSFIKDPETDKIVVEAWKHFTFLMSARQTGLTETQEVAVGMGRMSRMPHMLSCAALAVYFGCTPREILVAVTHDVGHRIKSHETDSLLKSEGSHTAHDADVPGFLYRSGFVDRLQAQGLCDEDGKLANGVHVSELAIREDEEPGIINHSTNSQFLDLDRLGYNLMQQATTPGGALDARAQRADVKRVGHPVYGDQLVFGSLERARQFSQSQAERWIRTWAARENLVVSQLSKMLTRHVLTSDHPLAAQYKTSFPGDSLRVLEEDWQEAVRSMAEDDPAIRGLLKIMDGLAEDTRRYNERVQNNHTHYRGPHFPAWVTVFDHTSKLADTSPSVRNDRLVLWINAGKERVVNAFAQNADGDLVRTHEAAPEVREFIDKHKQWATTSFSAVIELGSEHLGLTAAEQRAIRKLVSPRAAKRWQEALKRDPMTKEELTEHIRRQNERYRRVGALPVSLARFPDRP